MHPMPILNAYAGLGSALIACAGARHKECSFGAMGGSVLSVAAHLGKSDRSCSASYA